MNYMRRRDVPPVLLVARGRILIPTVSCLCFAFAASGLVSDTDTRVSLHDRVSRRPRYAIVKSVLVLWQVLAQVTSDGSTGFFRDGHEVRLEDLGGLLKLALD